jgi:hypothetical protein
VVPLVLPAPGVVSELGTAGVAVLGAGAGAAGLGALSGVAVVAPVVPPGGDASLFPGACAGGVSVLLGESVRLAAFGAAGGGTVADGGLAGVGRGVRLLVSGALGPNGLLESIPLCASIVPAQPVQVGGSSATRGSASLTSAGVARSSACASFTTTGCVKSML